MLPIQQNLTDFRANLERGVPIVCKGVNWQCEGRVSRLIRWLFRKEDARLEAIGRAFCKTLDQLEQKPVSFKAKNELANSDGEQYQGYFKTAQVVTAILQTSKSPKVKTQLNSLARRVTALSYRIETSNGGVDQTEIDDALVTQLENMAISWKKTQKLFTTSTLSENDRSKINKTSCHPHFVKLLESDKQLKQEFFKWTFRDNNDVDPFVQFPATCERLKQVYLAPRLGRFSENALSIVKTAKRNTPSKTQEKVICLPFFDGVETHKISILDEERQVQLNGDWQLKIKEIFNWFAVKNKKPGNLEYVGSKGIMNWNAFEQAPWNPKTKAFDPIDLQGGDWIKQLPISEVATKDQMQKKYGIEMSANEWLVCPRATRDTPDLNLEGRHGFLELAIPQKNGSWAIYAFGKYAARFPDSLKEFISFLLATTPAKISYPDENIYYSQRQHALSPIPLNQNDGKILLKSIGEDLRKGREGNLVIQFRGENCAKWVQSTLHKIPAQKSRNVYKAKMIDSSSANPVLAVMFKIMRWAPKRCQVHVIHAIDTLLGGSRGITIVENGNKIFMSVNAVPLNDKEHVYQPGELHEKIKRRELFGRIYAGHECLL